MKLVHTKMANIFSFCCNTHENRLISTSNDVLLVYASKVPHRRPFTNQYGPGGSCVFCSRNWARDSSTDGRRHRSLVGSDVFRFTVSALVNSLSEFLLKLDVMYLTK
jgi:hypothetical protein